MTPLHPAGFGGQVLLLEDLLIGARTLWAEARGCGRGERRAIAHTFVNRRDRRVGDADHSLAAVCLRHRQYSAWNEDDPNRPKLEAATPDDPVFRECLADLCEALNEPDSTRGARHYVTRDQLARRGWPASWGPERRPCLDVAGFKHLFFNDVA